RGERAAEEDGRVADLVRRDAARQRRALGGVADHVVDVADRGGGPRRIRAGGDDVDADVLAAQVVGELLGVDLQSRFRGGHAAAVVRYHADAAEIAEAHDRTAAMLFQIGGAGPGERGQ